jgi:hypothetical protein
LSPQGFLLAEKAAEGLATEEPMTLTDQEASRGMRRFDQERELGFPASAACMLPERYFVAKIVSIRHAAASWKRRMGAA